MFKNTILYLVITNSVIYVMSTVIYLMFTNTVIYAIFIIKNNICNFTTHTYM